MNSHMQLKTLIGYLGILILLSGCATQNPEHKILTDKSSGENPIPNYTFAIYNTESRLISHPLEDLLFHSMLNAKTADHSRNTEGSPKNAADKCNKPFTDIYIVSHGWNFTQSEAYANYHNYLDVFNQMRAKCEISNDFRPYFIFIVWPSTSRPLSSISQAMLPVGLDRLAEPVAALLDKTVIHTLTGWQESGNATRAALGSYNPNDYFGKSSFSSDYGYSESFFQNGDKFKGRDIPVSALIYDLLKLRPTNDPNNNKSQSPQQELLMKVVQDAKIHLVGHSYGAKLVAQAGMEALRRVLLKDDKVEEQLKKSGHGKRIPGTLIMDEFPDPNDVKVKEHFDNTFVNHKSGESTTLIESLVLLDPAMNPEEFWYGVGDQWVAPARLLQLIPRKAVVYNKLDNANGAMFSFREMLFNSETAQLISQPRWAQDTPILGSFVSGARGIYYLFWGATTGLLKYGSSFIMNLPLDFVHHVKEGYLREAYIPASQGSLLQALWKVPVNALDFFIPCPFCSPQNEDKLGLYRQPRPSLGLTGINRIGIGRPMEWEPYKSFELWGLTDFYLSDMAPDHSAEQFFNFSSSLQQVGNDINIDDERLVFHSFDASKVYDTRWDPIAGAHGDLRESNLVKACDKQADKDVLCQKRRFTVNFLYNFTHTNYIDQLKRTSD